MSSTLTTIIEDAYRVFAPYKHSGTLVVCNCNCCMSKTDEEALLKTPLREIPSALLAEYTNSAHTWDDKVAREMRYFLPRYLELIAAAEPPCNMGLDICLRRLGYANWRASWPKDEVEILNRFFEAFTAEASQITDMVRWPVGYLPEFDFGDVLTMVITAHGDLERVLAAWDAAPDPGAALHMADLRRDVLFLSDRTYWHSAYLDDYGEAADRIGAFLMRPEVTLRIGDAFFLARDPHVQKFLSDAEYTARHS